jgi:hypothetical protein
LELREITMQYKGYKDLECYIQARKLRIFVAELVKKFPSKEKFLLLPQIIDSSRSVTRNIAEDMEDIRLLIRGIFLLLQGALLMKRWNTLLLRLTKNISHWKN